MYRARVARENHAIIRRICSLSTSYSYHFGQKSSFYGGGIPQEQCSPLPSRKSFRRIDFLNLPCLFQQLRGAKVLGSEVREGNLIERKGRIMEVLKTQHTQQGRGGATIQVELRDVHSGLKSSERLRTSEAIEKVYADARSFTFLYEDGDLAILMEPKTFEQVEVPKSLFGNGASYLSDGLSVAVQFADGKPITASVPPRVTCKVAEAEPSFKGQTATPMYKKIVLDNGQQIMAPTFVEAGDEIIIETADNSYVTRAKG